MDHVAIMKKEWKLIPKILNGTKVMESRWYKSKRCPWDKLHIGDVIYFKNSGNPVTLKARVTKIEQHKIESTRQAFDLMEKHTKEDLGDVEIPQSVKEYISNKNYAIFVWFNHLEECAPFDINKKGFGMQSAWISIQNVKDIIK